MKKKRFDKILSITALSLLVTAFVILAVVGITYAANSSDTPIHVLNYETGKLYWSYGSERIDENGVYKLSLFESLPTGEDGEKILSPGDAYKNTVELRNKTGHEVSYTAVLYKISGDNVPIITDFSNIPDSNNEDFYTLPDGVTEADVVRAVSGNIGARDIQSFDIDWKWEYFVSDEQDEYDTALGNLEYSDVVMGVWITVSDPSTANPKPAPEDTNLDIDGDGIPDVNIDTDGDGEAELNIDTDGDRRPDINVDEVGGDGYPDTSIDVNGDGIPDFNFDIDGNGWPNENILGITIVDGIVYFPPEPFKEITALPEIDGKMTLKLDNFGKSIIGFDFPKQELADFIEDGGEIRVIMTNMEIEVDNDALKSLVESAKDTNVRIILKAILPDEFTETERSNIEPERLMYSFEVYAMSGTQIIRNLSVGKIKLIVPFGARSGTEIKDYKVYDVKNNGALNDTGAAYENGKFVLEAEELLRYAVVYEGDVDLSGQEPEPHECSCLICLFGKDNCRACWLCWTFLVLIALALIAIILKCTGLLNAKR